MKRGVIMQITPKEIMVLTPDGDFIKMKKDQKEYELGEEITIVDHKPSSVRKMKSNWKIKTLVSVMTALLLFVFSFIPALLSTSKVLAYISMDVTSSIELGITENLKVVEVKGINQEGKQIVEKLKNWKDQDIEEVINQIVTLNDRAGHLKTNPNILFSTVMVEEENSRFESSLQKKIEAVEDSSEVRDSVNVEMKKATIKDRKEASDNGISTGTYLEQYKKNSSSDSSRENKEKEDATTIDAKISTPLNENIKQPTNSSQIVNVNHSPVNNSNKQPATKKTEKEVNNRNRKVENQVVNEKSKSNLDTSKKSEGESKPNQQSNKNEVKGENRIEQNAKQQNVKQQNTAKKVRKADQKKTIHDKPMKKQPDYHQQSRTNPKKQGKDERMEKAGHDSKQKDRGRLGNPDDRKQR